MPNWWDLHRQTQDEDSNVRGKAAENLGRAFFQVPDKAQGWQDLIKLTQDEDGDVRNIAAYALSKAFSQVPDKTQAWQDIVKLAQNEDKNIQEKAFDTLYLASQYIPNKQLILQDLYRLTQVGSIFFGWHAANILGLVLQYIPDKKLAWQELHSLIFCFEDPGSLSIAAVALGSAFHYIPDKDLAWQELHRLTLCENPIVRWTATSALASAFEYIPDKQLAWQDLIKFCYDVSSFRLIGDSASRNLSSAFQFIPDKQLAWQDLRRLAWDMDPHMQLIAAVALGLAFKFIPDKEMAWQDLHRLTQVGGYVSASAYHSLGKISLFKSIEAKDISTLKSEFETTVTYFEKSYQANSMFNPSMFCYPFYRAYLAIIFKDAKEEEVQKYIIEAKKMVGTSKSRANLLKAVENLSEALQESQSLKNRSIQEVASDLNIYSQYCLKAAEYMNAAEDKAPGAIKLMRKCNPILDEKIRATIAQIQEKARLIGAEIERAARCLSLDNPIKVHQCCMRMASTLRDSCRRLPDEKKELTCGILIDIEKEMDLSGVLEKLELAMAYALPAIESERQEILDRLRNIEFGICKLNFSSGSSRQDLYELKKGIKSVQDMIAAQELSMDDLGKVLKERDYAMIERLERIRDDWLMSVEKMTQGLPSCEDKDIILKEIQGLRQSRRRDILGITGDIFSIAGLFIGLIG